MDALEKERYVYGVFQSIAGRYDKANNRISLYLHMRWKRAAVRMCKSRGRQLRRVLDVGCGTGDMLRLFSEELPGAALTGLDFSPKMLAAAEEKLAGVKNLRLERGNAMALPFADGSFDCVMISFALRNTADYDRVISEMARVLRPGGVFCCVDSFVPACKLILPVYRGYFSHIMPFLGGGKQDYQNYKWLSKSTEDYITAAQLSDKLYASGMTDAAVRKFMFGACVCLTVCKAEDGNERKFF